MDNIEVVHSINYLGEDVKGCELVLKHIDSFQLLNLQSWGTSSAPIHLESEVLNIITGRNETGKSVLFKMFYEICFPGYHGFDEIVRRGCDKGMFFIKLVNGTQYVFQINSNGSRVHYLSVEDSQETASWMQIECPQEVIQALGLIISYDARIILNVIDKDNPLPFIKTDPKYNASVLRNVLEPQGLTDFFARAKEYLTNIDLAKRASKRKYEYFDAQQAVFSYVDINELRYKIQMIHQATEVLEPMTSVYNSLVDVINVLGVERPAPNENVLTAEKLFTGVEALTQLKIAYTALQSIEPVVLPITAEQLTATEKTLDMLTLVKKLHTELSVLNSLQAPTVNTRIPSATSAMVVLTEIAALNKQCTVIQDLTEHYTPIKPVRPEIEVCMATRTQIAKLYKELQAWNTVQVGHVDAVMQIEINRKLYEVAMNELGTCPTCGRDFK